MLMHEKLILEKTKSIKSCNSIQGGVRVIRTFEENKLKEKFMITKMEMSHMVMPDFPHSIRTCIPMSCCLNAAY